MKAEYIAIFESFLRFFGIVYGVGLLIILVVLCITLYKNRKKVKKERLRAIRWEVLVLVLVLFLGAIESVPAIIDMRTGDICEVNYQRAYYHLQEDEGSFMLRPINVRVEDKEEEIRLYDTHFDFPYDIRNGTIVYGKHSKIILAYTGKVIHQDHY